ncbi:MAG TPA: cyclase family protein [Amycolatopsis sp.]|nr:cyclase family protein [Amycolatopsis sp.]
MSHHERIPAYDELPVCRTAPPRSSWGLWGADDQLGCLNLLAPHRIADAAKLVTRGNVFSLNASLNLFDAPLFGRPPLEHHIDVINKGRSRDDVLSSFNTQCSSQWDGLRHVRHSTYGFYNGMPETRLSISSWAERGIGARGVLLDLETYRARQDRPLRYETSDPIGVEDLAGAASDAGVEIRTGDVLVVHTGWLAWALRTSPAGLPVRFRAPGLRPGRDMIEHLWNLHIAAIASDTPAVEAWPPGAFTTPEQRRATRDDPAAEVDTFMHGELIALLGLPIGELWHTSGLAAACRQAGRWEFLLASAPINLPGGAASPSNALAIL